MESVVSDIAEEVYYARYHRLPEANYFLVRATETTNSTPDAVNYRLEIRVDKKSNPLSLDLKVNDAIWSPILYRQVTEQLAARVGLTAGITTPDFSDTNLLDKLSDGSAETIEEENQTLSDELERSFTNSALHEEAAVLLGAFALRDHSGHFFEGRGPLSRMTAHLAMAQYLRGTSDYGLYGRLAEAMSLTLMDLETNALQHLGGIETNEFPVAQFVRALRARNTGDYRELDHQKNRSSIETVEWLIAYDQSVSAVSAWSKLTATQKGDINVVRAVNQADYSVEMGHELATVSLPLELSEMETVYQLSRHSKLEKGGIVDALNAKPERCFMAAPGKAPRVCIIGWGQWAGFLQRHLCHAIQSEFDFLQRKLGAPEDAQALMEACDRDFKGLRLYPFVERYTSAEVVRYTNSIERAVNVTIATPELVPIECWNYLFYQVPYVTAPSASLNPFHLADWLRHDPPPGTVYDVRASWDHPRVASDRDTHESLNRLRELAPYDKELARHILRTQYNSRPSREQALELFGCVLPYSVYAMWVTANSSADKPEEYERLMLPAAELNPSYYFLIGDYFGNRDQPDKAAEYYDKACAADEDAVRVASYALWRVRYYIGKGQIEKARAIADQGAQVYSEYGLMAEGAFMALTTNYDKAFDWYRKIEERYNDSGPLIDFAVTHKVETGDKRFDAEIKTRISKLFPKGIEKVSVNSSTEPPDDGAVFQKQSALLTAAGLAAGDVIVAIGGVRVHNTLQYYYLRDSDDNPELDLIVWQDGKYKEIKTSPPRRRFGVNIVDYSRQQARR